MVGRDYTPAPHSISHPLCDVQVKSHGYWYFKRIFYFFPAVWPCLPTPDSPIVMNLDTFWQFFQKKKPLLRRSSIQAANVFQSQRFTDTSTVPPSHPFAHRIDITVSWPFRMLPGRAACFRLIHGLVHMGCGAAGAGRAL